MNTEVNTIVFDGKHLIASNENDNRVTTINTNVITSSAYDAIDVANKQGDVIYDTETNCFSIYTGGKWMPLMHYDDKEKKEDNNKIRITNCKCCGAALPFTKESYVKCDYCDIIQNAYILKE